MSLEKLAIRSCQLVEDGEAGQQVFHVCDSHALVQAAGYIKYIRAQEGETVYFRGQHRTYATMAPSLFRDCSTVKTQSGRLGRLKIALPEIRSACPIFDTFEPAVHEPLLQHYGLRTTWLDLVDNIWIALWFACHVPRYVGRLGEYVHFERRLPWREGSPAYAYVVLLASDAPQASAPTPGHFVGQDTEVVDLRLASPSVFVRPHAQHGVLMRMRGKPGGRPMDYSPQIRGVLRIDLNDALLWLGDGLMLGVHSLFPPPFYDSGYAILLNSGFAGDKAVGRVGITSP